MKIYRIIVSSLLVIGGLAAFYFSMRTLATQASWSRAANAAELAAEQAADGLPELKTSELAVRNDLRAANAGFGQILSAPTPTYDPQGNVSIELGTQDGLTAAANGGAAPLVHLFAPTGEGDESVYIGMFAVQQATERQAQLTPAFVVQPGEPQAWPANRGDWRLRFDVPPSRTARYIDLESDLVNRREAKSKALTSLETRRESVAEAQSALASREEALLGDPDGPEISDAPELKTGLIAQTTVEDRERAVDLAELDRLRRAVKNASDRLRAALAENVDLAGRLPTAAPPRTASGE